MAKDKKDLLIPLLPSTLTDELFNEYRDDIVKKFKKEKEVELPLKGKDFGITLNTTIISNISNKKFSPLGDVFEEIELEKKGIDNLDHELFEELKSPFERSIYKSKLPLKIKFLDKADYIAFNLFINSSKLKKSNFYIKTFTLTTYDTENEYVPLSNKNVITLSKWCAKTFNNFNEEEQSLYLFSWNEIPGNDNGRLIDFLNQNFGIDWVKTAKIEKNADGKTIKVSTKKNNLLLKLNNDKNKVILTINGERTKEFIVKKIEKGRLNIYQYLKELFDNPIIVEDGYYTGADDTFRSIQFWGNSTNYDELKDDARDVIIKDISGENNLQNMYYFYSIVTHDYKDGLLRRHLENINDVIGHCQSISMAYFDVFYGNVCLEVTIKPKIEVFKQIGHDSEEFRIWEILALQKSIVKNTDKLNDLEDFFDFSVFTKKLEKGGSWINYAKYLQEITGIQYYYKKRKREFELKEREKEKTLQRLNILIIISIFISIVTFFLTPIYSSIQGNLPQTMYNESIVKSSQPESKTIMLAILFTAPFYLYLSWPKISKSKEVFYFKQYLKENLMFQLILFIHEFRVKSNNQ